jgi:peptidoglycan/xylan/chitin deacetylase (PgdA/CDA1 family)
LKVLSNQALQPTWRYARLFVVLGLSIASPVTGQSDDGRLMVVTVDDLPYVSAGYPNTISRARRATSELLSAFVEHKLLVTAFVNESELYVDSQVDARIELLTRWAEAGVILGNHTFSHPDLNQLTAEEFQREIMEGHPATLRIMEPYEPYQRYFRYPQNHTGDTAEKKNTVAAFLKANDYEIAPHTVDSQDWIFNRLYVVALENDDREMAHRVQDAYVEFVIAATEFAENKAQEIFRQNIPQTLLIHANDLNADTLDRMLVELESRGYLYTSLTEAMQHPAYRTRDTYVTRAGPSWLWRWTNSLDLDVSFRGDPEPPAWILESFRESL